MRLGHPFARVPRAVALSLATFAWTATAAPPEGPPDRSSVPSAKPSPATASQDDPSSSGILPLPAIQYAPETGLGIGVYALYYFHTGEAAKTRTSTIASYAIVTTRGQILLDLAPDIYFDDDRFHAFADFAFTKFPDTYWGNGNGTRDGAAESYSQRFYGTALSLQRLAIPHLYVGGRYSLDVRAITEVSPGGILHRRAVAGVAGGIASGVGPAMTWDTRDAINAPSRGAYVDVSYLAFAPLWGSDYRYGRFQLDARQFVPLFRTHVLAFQEVSSVESYAPPFYLLSTLGGSALRGFYTGRYRDRVLLEAQVEYRFPIYWRFGATVFAGAGRVAEDLSKLDPAGLHVGFGGGLRFLAVQDERINIRLDIASGEGFLATYLNVGEAF